MSMFNLSDRDAQSKHRRPMTSNKNSKLLRLISKVPPYLALASFSSFSSYHFALQYPSIRNSSETFSFLSLLLLHLLYSIELIGFLEGTVVKNPPASARDVCSVPGLGRSPGGGNGNPLQYSYLENSMDRRAWWATVYGVAKSETWLSTHIKLTVFICMHFHSYQTSPLNKVLWVSELWLAFLTIQIF